MGKVNDGISEVILILLHLHKCFSKKQKCPQINVNYNRVEGRELGYPTEETTP